jgi:hypothetical protein
MIAQPVNHHYESNILQTTEIYSNETSNTKRPQIRFRECPFHQLLRKLSLIHIAECKSLKKEWI